MKTFAIEFSEEAKQDLAEQIAYYEDLRSGLESRFTDELKSHLSTIASISYLNIRYDEIRCVPLLRFPFMIHYSVFPDGELIRIHAIIHTSRNPSDNWNKDGWTVSEEISMYGVHAYDLEYYYAA